MIRSLLLFLFAAFAAAGQVVPGRYIVEFVDEPGAPAVASTSRFRMQDAAVAGRLSRVRSRQALAEQQIAGMNGRVRNRVENVANALVVEIPDAQAAALRALPGVKGVYQDETVHLLLDHAVAVHRVPEVWNSLPNGRDSAGAGIKVGIIDSGISIEHPGFKDDGLPAIDGYPKTDTNADKAYTNAKIIVARNYSSEENAQDRNGHGSAVAMAAAGAAHQTPIGEIAGVAPKAYLGIYKVSGGDGGSTFSAFLAALDDALADGMDVVNYSSGATVTSSSSLQSVVITAVERAFAAGMLVTISAGNSGPGASTIATPAIAPSAITVAASANERVFGAGVVLGEFAPYASAAGNGPAPASPVEGPVADTIAIGTDGLACTGLPAEQLTGKIALILRGSCSFATKIGNATSAGAIAVVIYNNVPNADLVRMDVAGAALPAVFISAEDGADASAKLVEAPDLTAKVNFDPFNPLPVSSNRMASFSSAGPTALATLKPD
ncbi:MAG: S8 family serine peptidase, partial [Bryobacteraceae bacterium]